VAVIGLGRFGSALALELMASGAEVLGIDGAEDIVQEFNGRLSRVVQADSTKPEVLEQLGVADFDRVVVAIGSDIESSILTTSLLLRAGVTGMWAKAVSEAHALILEQLGVTHVVRPERDMGRRVAHLVRGRMQDFLEVGDDFSLVKMNPAVALTGKPLSELGIRTRYGVTIAAVKTPDKNWTYATAETVLAPEDAILVTGPTERVEHFSELT
jgi:trk system potassium uptake protein TrkA